MKTLDMHIQEIELVLMPLQAEKKARMQIQESLLREVSGAVVRQVLEDKHCFVENEDTKLSSYLKNLWESSRGDERSLELQARSTYVESVRPKILQQLSAVSPSMRLVAAYALDTNGLLRFSCNDNFDYYKTPSECPRCNTAEINVNDFGLANYFVFQGDREYWVDKELLMQNVIDSIRHIDNVALRSALEASKDRFTVLKCPDEQLIADLEQRKEQLVQYQTEFQKELNEAIQVYRTKCIDAINRIEK